MIDSAIGDRTEFMVQENSTADGKSLIYGLGPNMQHTDQRKQSPRRVGIKHHFFR